MMLEAATEARANAYCPYSHYAVGAAVVSADGAMFAGCNVENTSSPLTVCAERNAIAAMVATGRLELAEVLVVTEDCARPCGACLQVIAEFAVSKDIPIHVHGANGQAETLTLGALLPQPFRKRRDPHPDAAVHDPQRG
jgi:cytidine deaminase